MSHLENSTTFHDTKDAGEIPPKPPGKPQKTYSDWNLTLTAKCERENCKFNTQVNTILALVKIIKDHNLRCNEEEC